MAARRNRKLKTFRAVMHVVRLEEWCVEARGAEEARALLAAGEGYRCHSGECLHADLDLLLE